jgi:hypothetical protein
MVLWLLLLLLPSTGYARRVVRFAFPAGSATRATMVVWPARLLRSKARTSRREG